MAKSYNRRINLYINGKEVKNDISSISGEMRKLQNEQRRMTVGSQEYVQHGKKIRQLKGIIQEHNQQIKATTSLWQKTKNVLSKIFPVAGIATFIATLRNAVRVSNEFSSAQSNLAAVLGKTKAEIKDLTKDAVNYGKATKFTASEVTELQTAYARLGFSTDEIRASTRATLDLAAATNAELGPAAETVGVALRAYGLSAEYAEDVSATLAVATTKSALSFNDYKTILSTVGPVAKSFGFSLEDSIALIGKLRDSGFDAGSAATATRNILLNMADSSGKLATALGRPVKTLDDLVPALDELRSKGINLNETLQLTDKRSVAAFSTFLEAGGTMIELRDSITGVNDELQQMVDTQLDNLAGDITILKSAWEGFILSLEAGDGVIARFARVTIKLLTDAITELSMIDLVFKKASKFTSDEMERAYDAVMSLSGNKYRKFQGIVREENKLTIEQVKLRKDAMIEEIRATGQNQVEAERLWQEFYNRRLENETKANSKIIGEQNKLLDKIKKVPAATKEEIAVKEEKIKVIETEIDRIIELTEAEILLQKARQKEVLEENVRLTTWEKVVNFHKARGNAIKTVSLNAQTAAQRGINAASDLQKGINTLEKNLEKFKKQREEGLKPVATPDPAKPVIEKELAKLQKEAFQLEKFLEADKEQQMDAVRKYFHEAGKNAFGEFLNTIETESAKKKVDIKATLKFQTEESEETDPTLDYAIEQYRETLDFQRVLLEAQWENNLIGEQEYQDKLTEITRRAEEERFQEKLEYTEKARQLTDMGFNFLMSMMDLELAHAGENEEEKVKIRKKYANTQFLITASQIVVDTASAIMKALAELGPIAGVIASAIIGATGTVQLAAANAERQKMLGYEKGGYTMPGRKDKPAGIVHAGEYVIPQEGVKNPQLRPFINAVEIQRKAGNLANVNLNGILNTIPGTRLQTGGFSKDETKTNYSHSANLPADNTNQIVKAIKQLSTDIKDLKIYAAIETIEKEKKKFINIKQTTGL